MSVEKNAGVETEEKSERIRRWHLATVTRRATRNTGLLVKENGLRARSHQHLAAQRGADWQRIGGEQAVGEAADRALHYGHRDDKYLRTEGCGAGEGNERVVVSAYVHACQADSKRRAGLRCARQEG